MKKLAALIALLAVGALGQITTLPGGGAGTPGPAGDNTCVDGTAAPTTGTAFTCYVRTDTSPKELWIFVATNTPYFVSTISDTTVAGSITLSEATANGSNFWRITAPSVLGQDFTLTLPNAQPAANQILRCPAPTANVSACVWATPAWLDTTNTFTGAQDASGASTTKPMKSGTSLPGTCSVGEFYNKTDATNTNVIYACTATNTWTAQGGGSTTLMFSTAGVGHYAPYGYQGQEPIGVAGAANRVMCWEMPISFSATVRGVIATPTSAGADTGTVVWGIYNSSRTKVVQGAMTMDGSGNPKKATFSSDWSATPGVYYNCMGTSSTSTNFRGIAQSTAAPQSVFYNVNNIESSALRRFYCSGDDLSSTTLPTTCTTPTIIYHDPPLIMLVP